MQRYFKLFLIVLLSARALVGDAMAYSMMNALQSANMAAEAMHSKATQPVAMPCHETEDDSAALPSACTTCQVCHLSVFLAEQFVFQTASQSPIDSPAAAISWQSAELVALIKPPIL